MTRAQRDKIRKDASSKEWSCSADLLNTLLDALDASDEEVERLNDVIRKLAREKR